VFFYVCRQAFVEVIREEEAFGEVLEQSPHWWVKFPEALMLKRLVAAVAEVTFDGELVVTPDALSLLPQYDSVEMMAVSFTVNSRATTRAPTVYVGPKFSSGEGERYAVNVQEWLVIMQPIRAVDRVVWVMHTCDPVPVLTLQLHVKQPDRRQDWVFFYESRCLVPDFTDFRRADDLTPMVDPATTVLASQRMRAFLQCGLLHGEEVSLTFRREWTELRPHNAARLWSTKVRWRFGTQSLGRQGRRGAKGVPQVCTPRYSIRRLVRALKAAVLADDVEVSFCHDQPLRLRFVLPRRAGELNFYVHGHDRRERTMVRPWESH
jgi:hypothetical protein